MLYRYLYIGIFAAIILTCSHRATAQSVDSVKLDTLISVLTLQREDVRTVNAYLELSNEYERITDYGISLTYANLARELSEKIQFTEGQLQAALKVAHIYLVYYIDFEKAARYYDESLQLAKVLNSDKDLVSVYRGYALVYSSVKNYALAISFNDKAVAIAESLSDQQLLSDLKAYGGNMYEEMGDTAKAIALYKEVESIEQQNNFMNTSNASLTTVAHYYFLIGEIEKSLKLYRSAITRFERLQDFRWKAYTHSEIAKVYLADKNFEKAEMHSLEGLEIAERLELNKEKADNYFVLALIYKRTGNTEKQRFYEDAYNALMDSTIIDISPRIVDPVAATDAGQGKPAGSQIPSALVILMLTVLLVFITALPRKKR